MRIRIATQQIELFGTLDDTPTARSLLEALPHSSQANTWGEEVYFSLPVKTALDSTATDVVEPGTICYWVQGNSLALPYGPTPVSEGNECRLVTAVNRLGQLEGDPKDLAQIQAGDTVTVSITTD